MFPIEVPEGVRTPTEISSHSDPETCGVQQEVDTRNHQQQVSTVYGRSRGQTPGQKLISSQRPRSGTKTDSTTCPSEQQHNRRSSC